MEPLSGLDCIEREKFPARNSLVNLSALVREREGKCMSEWVFADLAQTQHNIQAASDVCSGVNDGFTITMGAEIMRAIVRHVTDGIGICAYGRSAYTFWAISVDVTKSQWP